MKKLKTFRVESNRIIFDFKSIIKHPNYDNLDQNSKKCLNTYYQTTPSKQEVRQAKQLKYIERQNMQLKEFPHKNLIKLLQTAFNSFKQEINAVVNNARQSQIKFTAKVIHIFQFLNKSEFE
ncbi:Hypothetical_protein [Hexamita inflata]|uniref:Hypothetical_protein n=1 Tax=Hexamita inflata TaxID=28002 RepID=A0AA86QU77_9EUKA|nr:Hypothetical protein HINF_LOCUS51883 [Hexamita inflata]